MYKLHDYEGAIKDLEELNQTYGKNYAWGENINLLLGIAYLELNKFDSSLFCLDKSIKQDSENNRITSHHYVYLGICHTRRRDSQQGMQSFQKAIQIDKYCPEAYFQMAQISHDSKIALLFLKKSKQYYNYRRNNPYKDYPEQVYMSGINDAIEAYE